MTVNELIESLVFETDKVDFTERTWNWCRLPYPDHPKGCPNFGVKDGCPPATRMIHDFMQAPFFVVALRFDLEAQANRMKQIHPGWSERRARCLLYWQNHVLRELTLECYRKLGDLGLDYSLDLRPEAHGVNLFTTMVQFGIRLERNPTKYVWKIALIGKRKSYGS